MGRTTMGRKAAGFFTVRRSLVLVAVAGFASWVTVKVLHQRDYLARAGPSRHLILPIIEYHEARLRSDRICSQTNARTATGHLGRAVHQLGVALRAKRQELAARDPSSYPTRFTIRTRDAFEAARAEWQLFASTSRTVEKQCLMAAYHTRMIDHYGTLLDAHRVVLPPLPAELAAGRRALMARLRTIGRDPGLILDPEPPPSSLPGRKTPPGQAAWATSDSY